VQRHSIISCNIIVGDHVPKIDGCQRSGSPEKLEQGQKERVVKSATFGIQFVQVKTGWKPQESKEKSE
jgi:hypothetical protein